MLGLRDLTRRYGDTVVLDGLSLEVPEGEVVGFVGPNGAGKTTAMRIALGVLEQDSGEVLWRGRPVSRQVHHRFGYMPEERGLYPKMRADRHLRYLASLHGASDAEAELAAERWIERLGLTGQSEKRVEELSLGNQQRVQLGAALVHDPEALILDEPFSGLDPIGADVMAEVLFERAGEGVAVIFSSHQLELVERICNTVAIVNRGRIVAAGRVDDLRTERSEPRLRVEVEAANGDWVKGLRGVEVVSRDANESPPGAARWRRRPGGARRRPCARVRCAASRRPARRWPSSSVKWSSDELTARDPVRGSPRDHRAAQTAQLPGLAARDRRAGRGDRLVAGLVGVDEHRDVHGRRAGPQAVAVAEAATAAAPRLDAELEIERFSSAGAARAAVRDESVDAALVGRSIVSLEEPDDALAQSLQAGARQVGLAEALRAEGVPADQARTALDPPPLRVEPLEDDTAKGAPGVAFTASILLYGLLVVFGIAVAQGVVEEKASRVIEVLLSTIPPRPLLIGKILGIGVIALVQLVAAALAGLAVAAATGVVALDGPIGTPAQLGDDDLGLRSLDPVRRR